MFVTGICLYGFLIIIPIFAFFITLRKGDLSYFIATTHFTFWILWLLRSGWEKVIWLLFGWIDFPSNLLILWTIDKPTTNVHIFLAFLCFSIFGTLQWFFISKWLTNWLARKTEDAKRMKKIVGLIASVVLIAYIGWTTLILKPNFEKAQEGYRLKSGYPALSRATPE